MTMEEVWREIPEWESFYAASTLGRIKSLIRETNNQYGKTEHILAGNKTNSGYLSVMLHKNGTKKKMLVARLVAFTFPEICGEYFEGAEIDHINTIRTDNRPENLRWVDRKGQFQNEKTKRNIKKRADNSGRWVIKLSKNNEILHFYPSIQEAARENNTSPTDIYNCCNHIRSRKTAKGYIWKYAE